MAKITIQLEKAKKLILSNKEYSFCPLPSDTSINGLYINHSRVTPNIVYLLRTGVDIKIGQNPQNLIELKYFNSLDKVSINTNSKITSLKNNPVVLR